MRKFFRWLLIIIIIIIVLIGAFASFIAIRGIPKHTAENYSLKVASTPERIERGQQLSTMLCNDCHLDPNG